MSKPTKKQAQQRRRIALGFLIFAGLALLATLVMLLFKGSQLLGLFTPEKPEAFNLGLSLSAGLTLLALAVYALLVPGDVRKVFAGRQAQYGTNAGIMLIAFVGLLLAINWVLYSAPAWLPKPADLTEDKQRTLAPETLATLEKLTEPVAAQAFYSSRLSNAQAVELLTDYRNNSNGMFDFTLIDPEYNPVAAQNAGITHDGTIVLYQGDRREEAASVSEQGLTSALVRLIEPQSRVVYFLTGHGERDIAGQDENALSYVSNALSFKNYTVKTLNLLTEGAVPADALAVVIAGPKVPLMQGEVATLDAYLQTGGSLVALLDPPVINGQEGRSDPLAEYLRDVWLIGLRDDIVIDPSNSTPSEAVAAEYAVHPITEKLDNVVTVFPTARSLEVENQKGSVVPDVLVRTGDSAWGETDFAQYQAGEQQYDEGADTLGPILLAATAENLDSQARVVVIGDSDFATDQNFGRYRNGPLFLNSVDWAAEQENLLGITPSTTTERSLKYLNGFQLISLLLGAICLLPLAVVGAGVWTWLARRKRG